MLNARLYFGKLLRPCLICRPVQLCLDALSGAAAVLVAYLLRSDFFVPEPSRAPMLLWTAILLIVYPAALWRTDGYRTTWQFFCLRDLGGLFRRALPCLGVLMVARAALGTPTAMPYSVALIWFGLVLAFSSSIRIARRLDHEAVQRGMRGSRRTLLVGTEESLAAAIRQLGTVGESQLIGLVAENRVGTKIAGISVLGRCSDVPKLILSQRIEVVMASEASLPCITELIETCADLNVEFRLLPSAKDVAQNTVRVIRKVSPLTVRRGLAHSKPEELHPDVVACLTGQVVLVTGAGGSIGSELARQIASAPVSKLVLLDQDENSIFELLNEIGQHGSVVPHIADIRDSETIRHIFSQHAPDVVFHAAAYKHVPLMEQNPCEAVITNVAGTREIARAAMEVGAKRFVLISSDKAVKPSSIMGASKRVAEMTVQHCASSVSLDATLDKTQFACVRFGNVLGSRGSVLPTFIKQIAAGGPITVTNAEMTRYFMTIPQAVRLVLQAATLASTGDIYMLDMGSPVRIMDFARDVIHASGLVVDRDIEIKVVGSRPGEKLHEQLWDEDATISPTQFPEVFRVHASALPLSLTSELEALILAAHERRADDVRAGLRSMPIDYEVARAHAQDIAVTAHKNSPAHTRKVEAAVGSEAIV